MTKLMEIYKCDLCGNIVEVCSEAAGELVCCNQKMTLKIESTADSTTEKHVPFIEKNGNTYTVKVGEKENHPMTEAHYIQWIELITENKVYRKYLKPSEAPEATFILAVDEKVVAAREYCNLHGNWKGTL
ncbi:MAG: desulfoferrodoxin [Fusobacteria bacterium]|jgi:superoxide reductase|nr:desulfoferrodoxin [Fusobacteriota bacterium]